MRETRSRYGSVCVLVAFLLLVPLFSMNVAADSLPGAPINPIATGGIARITISWTAPANTGPAITGYTIYKWTNSTDLGAFEDLPSTPCTFVDLTVQNGHTYNYYVTAKNNVGEGSPSTNVSAAPLSSPFAPTGLVLTPGVGGMSLSWNPPYNDGGSTIICYRVYRGTSSSTLLYLKNTTQTSIIDGGLSNGQTYYYQITAVNIVGEGAKSDTVHRTLSSPPGPLLDFQAVASASRVNLTWTAPSDNGGSAITGYLIYRSLISGQETFLQQVTSSTSYQDSNLANGVTYYYQVSAVNSAGEGQRSNELARVPTAVLGPPTSVTATPANSSVYLTWAAPANTGGSPASSYKIYRGTSATSFLFLASVNQTSYRDMNLTNGHGYFYRVSSVNAVGEGLPGAPIPSTPVNTASVPFQLNSVSGIRSVALSWSTPADIGGASISTYRIYRSLSGTGTFDLIASVSGTTYTDKQLNNGTLYFYHVTAVNSAGEGPAAATSSTTFPLPDPPVLNASMSGMNVHLAWSACPSAISYRIYRGDVSGGQTYLRSVLTNSYLDGPFVSGRTVFYLVTVVNATGESLPSNEASVKIVSLPSAPLNLTASIAWSEAVLRWEAPLNFGSASTITYQVLRGLSPGSEQVIGTCDTSAYNDSTIDPAQQYYYQVKAVNQAGAGAASNEVGVYYRNVFTASVLTVIPGLERITLQWTVPTDTDGNPLTGYQVYRRGTGAPEAFLIGENITALTDTGVVAGQVYYYEVKGVTEAELGPASNEVNATPFSFPGTPVSFSAAASADSAILNWSAPVTDGNSSVIGYHVFRGGAAGNLSQVATVSGLNYTDTGLVAGTTYYYEVTAFNAAGDGHASSETSITAPVLNDPPVGLTATVSGGKITLEWNPPAGTNVFTYSIYRGNGSGVEVFLTNFPGTSWVDSNVSDGQTYYYRVSATTMHGESQMSEEAVVTTVGAQNQIQAGIPDQLWFRMVIIMTILVVGFFSFVVFVRNGTLRVNMGR